MDNKEFYSLKDAISSLFDLALSFCDEEQLTELKQWVRKELLGE